MNLLTLLLMLAYNVNPAEAEAPIQDRPYVHVVSHADLVKMLSSSTAVQTSEQYLRVHAYTPSLTQAQVQRGIAYAGANLRLRSFIEKLLSGDQVSIGVIGGSISWGFYMQRGVNDWFALFTTWLKEAFPKANIKQRNGCVPATTAEYVSMCLSKFVDRDVDVIFVEYSINDGFQASARPQEVCAWTRLVVVWALLCTAGALLPG
jgi:hypothetical protein